MTNRPRLLADQVDGHKADRRPGAREEWLAVTKHDRVQVEAILIDQTEISEALRQFGSGNVDLAGKLSLQPAYRRLEVTPEKRGVGAERLQRARYDPLRLVPPRRRELAFLRAPHITVIVPITHHLVRAATVHEA